MSLKPVEVEATTLPDAWYQCLYKCLEICGDFEVDRGSYAGQKRLEFDHIRIHVKHPDAKQELGQIAPLIPTIPEQYSFPPPCDEKYIEDYLPYLFEANIQENEEYTYGQRIHAYQIPNWFRKLPEGWIDHTLDEIEELTKDKILILDHGNWILDQAKLLVWTYKNKGHRNNQMIISIEHPCDILLKNPPCLRHIDTRIQDGKLHFSNVYFRSWDLFNGFPANLAAIELFKQSLADEIGVENGELIAVSKGLHIYDHVWEIAESLRGKTIEQFREEALAG